MTNEELAAAILKVRRLSDEMEKMDPATIDLEALDGLKHAIEDLGRSVKSVIDLAVHEQSEFKEVEFVNCNGVLAQVLVHFYMDGKINHGVEYMDKNMRDTKGITFVADGLTAADPADFAWDAGNREWRLKPSGTAPV